MHTAGGGGQAARASALRIRVGARCSCVSGASPIAPALARRVRKSDTDHGQEQPSALRPGAALRHTITVACVGRIRSQSAIQRVCAL